MTTNEETADVLSEYHDQFAQLTKHLLDNPLLDDGVQIRTILSFGSGLFRLGAALKAGTSPEALVDHTTILVPDIFLDEVHIMLAALARKHAKSKYDDLMEKAKSVEEEKKLTRDYNEYLAKDAIVT